MKIKKVQSGGKTDRRPGPDDLRRRVGQDRAGPGRPVRGVQGQTNGDGVH